MDITRLFSSLPSCLSLSIIRTILPPNASSYSSLSITIIIIRWAAHIVCWILIKSAKSVKHFIILKIICSATKKNLILWMKGLQFLTVYPTQYYLPSSQIYPDQVGPFENSIHCRVSPPLRRHELFIKNLCKSAWHPKRKGIGVFSSMTCARGCV